MIFIRPELFVIILIIGISINYFGLCSLYVILIMLIVCQDLNLFIIIIIIFQVFNYFQLFLIILNIDKC